MVISRRRFLKDAALAGAAVAMPVMSSSLAVGGKTNVAATETADKSSSQEPQRRPNIVFVFADDWGRYASAYAKFEGEKSLNHLISTPNIDRIAGEGAIFKNAFVPAPSCTPCRSSVLTGRYFWNTGLGAILQGAKWDESIPSYPLLLEKAGYHIGFTYKAWSPGQPTDAPYGGKRAQYQVHENLGYLLFGKFGDFSQNATAAVENGDSVEQAKRTLCDEVRVSFESFLDARPAGTPICYWWGPVNTHRKWQKGSGKTLWGIEPDSLEGRLPAFLPDVPEVREDIADYLGECMAVDLGVGELIAKLEEIGELDNTLFVISGDHGIPGFPRAKCNLYDLGCEVALIARWPGHIRAGREVEDMVNMMDIAPTFLEAAGVAIPEGVSGKSLVPVFESSKSGQIDPERTEVILGRERHGATARAGNLPYPHRALRTHDYLYIRNYAPERWPTGDPCGLDDPTTEAPSYELLVNKTATVFMDMDAGPTKAWIIHHRGEEIAKKSFAMGFGKRPAEELYDLRRDPDYMVNVASDPAYADTLKQLATRLETRLRSEGDPRVCENPCRFELPPFAGE